MTAVVPWVRFHLVLGHGSRRWFPPFLVLALWSVLAVQSLGPGFGTAAAMYPVAAIWAAWTTIALGSVDDDPHHGLLAAAAGSVARIHRLRALTVAVPGVAWALVMALLVGLLAPVCTDAQRRSPAGAQCDQPRPLAALLALVVLSAGVWAGIGIGSLVHRPILSSRAVTLAGALALLAGMMILPPVQHTLLSIDRGHRGPALVLQAVTAVWAVGAVLAASHLAAHRSR